MFPTGGFLVTCLWSEAALSLELSEPRGEGQGRWAPFINIQRLNFIFSSMKIRISEWLDPIRFFLTDGVTVRSLSQLFVLVRQAVLSPLSPQCAPSAAVGPPASAQSHQYGFHENRKFR